MADTPFTQMGQLVAELASVQKRPAGQSDQMEKAVWRAVVGDAIADHTVVYQKEVRWMVIADGPIWRHAVKQREREFLVDLKERNVSVRGLTVEVRPRASSTAEHDAPAVSRKPLLDSKSAALLESAAENLRSQDLSQALKRLSRLRTGDST